MSNVRVFVKSCRRTFAECFRWPEPETVSPAALQPVLNPLPHQMSLLILVHTVFALFSAALIHAEALPHGEKGSYLEQLVLSSNWTSHHKWHGGTAGTKSPLGLAEKLSGAKTLSIRSFATLPDPRFQMLGFTVWGSSTPRQPEPAAASTGKRSHRCVFYLFCNVLLRYLEAGTSRSTAAGAIMLLLWTDHWAL